MKHLLKVISLSIFTVIGGCTVQSVGKIKNPPIAAGSGADVPATGYIAFVGVINNHSHLYRQDMDGMNPVGPPVRIYEDSSPVPNLEDGDARYPQITPDGRYIIFITRKTNGIPGSSSSGYDEIQVIDHTGYEWNSMTGIFAPNGTCDTINYPEIIQYKHDPLFYQTDFVVASVCAQDWANRYTMITGLGVDASYYLDPNDGFVDGLENLPRTEYAVHPSYDQSGGYILSSNSRSLKFSKFVHNQPGVDFISTTTVYIDSSQALIGGHCKGQSGPCPIPSPTTIKDGFAPSISPDGGYVMYNAEVYNDVPARGEEIFVIDLPQTDLETAYTPTGPFTPPFVSTINEMAHVNTPADEYGAFTVNGQHQYTIHTKAGGELWVAEDLTSPRIQIPLPAGLAAREAHWFYQ